jgi:hypothetical protein
MDGPILTKEVWPEVDGTVSDERAGQNQDHGTGRVIGCSAAFQRGK